VQIKVICTVIKIIVHDMYNFRVFQQGIVHRLQYLNCYIIIVH